MALQIIITSLLCGVFCLGPLALYLMWLGALNRRSRPTVVGGPWDFVALVAGLAGFLLFGGAVVLAGADTAARSALGGNWAQLRGAWGADRIVWFALTAGYLVFVGGFLAFGVWGRVRTLAVYNLTRERAETAVESVLAETGVPAARFGNVWATGGSHVVAVDVFPGFRHVTVRLLASEPRVREELERGLRTRFEAVPVGDNPIAVWVTTAAVSCLIAALGCVLMLYYIFYAAG